MDSPILMASITKLFTTTCILVLLEQKKMKLDTKISTYFDHEVLDGLHVYQGYDYSQQLTIADLLFQTSGLPDVFEEGSNGLKNRTQVEDFSINFSELVAMNKKLRPHFSPNDKKRAYYSDINFDLLGEIIERVSGFSLAGAYKEYITEPLGLMNTFLPLNNNECIPKVYYKKKLIHRPKFIVSCRASGGCVITSAELMTFIQAFFSGKLFDRTIFEKLSNYKKLQFSMGPIYYGGGYMQIPLNGIYTLFQGKGELLGHSGTTGSFAFYYPLQDLYFVGNLNQLAVPSLPIKLLMQLAMKAKMQ